MENNTKTGLLLIIIGMIIAAISNILLFFIDFNVDISNIEEIYVVILPALIVAVVGGLLILIGALLMIIGRKDYGEQHSKFVVYAIVIFCINIVAAIILKVIQSALIYLQVSSPMSGPSSYDFSGMIIMALIQMIISTIMGGLCYVFLLYHLENEKGRYVLFAAFITSIVLAIGIAIYNYGVLTEMINGMLNSGDYSSSVASQALAQISNISKAGILNIVSGILFIIATYIPYRRITSGELVPVLPSHLKRCHNCGRVVRKDYKICPYCGKEIEAHYQIGYED